ncbi:uroporphyrinogen decarboxylase family protein [Acetobacterium malicum]|uniref:uroporphyrinogen decarboxylase family protein n=1 Tax=Acetobacterium malicum TaxID=52692 RepID=UPI0004111BAE|nr:uroporphyrinogen decarboxylase family protein [Acetobacterium dehalogenans]
MKLTPRENFLNFYQNKPMERFPDFMLDINPVFSITGMDERSPNNENGKDWYGCDWVLDPGTQACVLDVSKPPLFEEIEDWREIVKFPDLDAIDWAANAKADGVDNFDPDKLNYLMLLEGPFERLHTLMGFENALCAMISEPEEVEALFDKIMEVKIKSIEVLVKHYKVEVINFHDDWGTQKDLFFSPDLWRRLLKPQIKKAVDACHKNGIIFELHCCGKIDSIIPELVDIGVDCVQCMGINPIAKVKKLTGDKLAYMVSPRYQSYDTIKDLTEEKLRKLIREEITEEAVGGRYMSFFWPMDTWWLPIVMDEIKKCGEELLGEKN